MVRCLACRRSRSDADRKKCEEFRKKCEEFVSKARESCRRLLWRLLLLFACNVSCVVAILIETVDEWLPVPMSDSTFSFRMCLIALFGGVAAAIFAKIVFLDLLCTSCGQLSKNNSEFAIRYLLTIGMVPALIVLAINKHELIYQLPVFSKSPICAFIVLILILGDMAGVALICLDFFLSIFFNLPDFASGFEDDVQVVVCIAERVACRPPPVLTGNYMMTLAHAGIVLLCTVVALPVLEIIGYQNGMRIHDRDRPDSDYYLDTLTIGVFLMLYNRTLNFSLKLSALNPKSALRLLALYWRCAAVNWLFSGLTFLSLNVGGSAAPRSLDRTVVAVLREGRPCPLRWFTLALDRSDRT
jgi:hypothetical protein